MGSRNESSSVWPEDREQGKLEQKLRPSGKPVPDYVLLLTDSSMEAGSEDGHRGGRDTLKGLEVWESKQHC